MISGVLPLAKKTSFLQCVLPLASVKMLKKESTRFGRNLIADAYQKYCFASRGAGVRCCGPIASYSGLEETYVFIRFW